jgi:hypothetical protein
MIDMYKIINIKLHVAGYYGGLLKNVDMIKDAFKVTKAFIEKIK